MSRAVRWFVIALSLFPYLLRGQQELLETKVKEATASINGSVGVAVLDLDDARSLTSLNGDSQFPMQSVYKFPLGMAVLDLVDKGKLSLDQKIHLQKSDLLPDTWSPMREKYPEGNVDVTLREVIEFTVSKSDNNGCDLLFRLIGGPNVADAYIHGLGVKQIAIKNTEAEMHKDYKAQFNNWSTPIAMAQLLRIFYEGKVLSATSHAFLMKIMLETPTGPHRIKGLLPEGTLVAHKTGNSGSNEAGVTAAANDVGIVTLPNGKHIAVVVYVSNTTADNETIDTCIASISKASWDYFTAK